MDNPSIAKNVLYQRKLKGYTQEDLANKTQVTVRTIQRIEKGDVNPHLQTVKLLAVALEVEVEDLLPLENPKAETIQQKWLLLLHGIPLLGLFLPLFNILFPLFLWVHKRDDHPVYYRQGIQVINFQISMSFLYAFAFVALLTIQGWGFLLFIAVIPFSLLMSLINIFRVIQSKSVYYPLSIPFLKQKKISKNTVGVLVSWFALFSLMSCQQPTSNPSIERLDGSTISQDSLTAQIQDLIDLAKIPGIAISIFDDNKAVYQKTLGFQDYEKKIPLNDSTNIYAGSFSKAVFGVLVLRLVEEGLLDLDTPLESYLPKKIYTYEPQTRWHDDYSALEKDTLYPQITARMCLAHTSGFPNWRWFMEGQQLKVTQQPGSRYLYSGEGFVYLQVVLEKMLGKGLEELAQEYVFQPLGMEDSSYEWKARYEDNFTYGYTSEMKAHHKDTDNEPRSGSTMETTATDYTRFLEAVLQKELLKPETWELFMTPQVRIRSAQQFGPCSLIDTTLFDNIQLSYGFGWGIIQSPYGKGIFKECHGDGFQHYSILFPEAGKGMMIMTNSDNGESIYQALLNIGLKDHFTPFEWERWEPLTLIK